MLSNAEDLVRWAQALYGGEVLPSGQLEDMMSPARGSGGRYGLGCFLEELGGLPSFGHSGATQGYEARLRWIDGAEGATTVATLVSIFDLEESPATDIDLRVWELLLNR